MAHSSIRSWPRVTISWIEWVERLEPKFSNHQKKVGIYEHIILTKHDYTMDRRLLATALSFRSVSSNCLFFPYGPMTPIVLDLCAFIGFPATGEIPNATCDPDVDIYFHFSTSFGNSYGGCILPRKIGLALMENKYYLRSTVPSFSNGFVDSFSVVLLAR